MRWWLKELNDVKGQARKSRKRWQKTEKERREDVDVRLSDHKRILSEYNYRLIKAKEENWRQFVSVCSNLDQWEVVYRVCRGKNVKECLIALNVNSVEYVMWKECTRLIMELRAWVRRDADDCDGTTVRSFELSDIERAIARVKLGKAPGLNDMNTVMLRAM